VADPDGDQDEAVKDLILAGKRKIDMNFLSKNQQKVK